MRIKPDGTCGLSGLLNCNSACQALHARLREAGKPPKVINIAIAHKLLRQAFAVAMSQRDYSEDYA